MTASLPPGVPPVHRVPADKLAAAGPRGPTAGIRDAVAGNLLAPIEPGAAAGLRTSATLGPGAELTAGQTPAPVLRVDWPISEAALDRGRRIAVAAALPSTPGSSSSPRGSRPC